MLDLFGIPAQMMPKIQPSMGNLHTVPQLLGQRFPLLQYLAISRHHSLPTAAIALMVKCTYGTAF